MTLDSPDSCVTPLNHRAPEIARDIVDLQRAAYAIEAQLVGFPDLPPLAEEPVDIMASNERFFGISRSGRLAGMISLEDGNKHAVITRLCVNPDLARQGIASRLVRHVLNCADTEVAVTTAQANFPAIALYESMGFFSTGTSPSREGLPLVILINDRTGR